MTYLDNRSPFPAELLSFPSVDGQEVQVLVAIATLEETETGSLAPAAEQRPVPLSDVYFGEPALSSVRYEAETAIKKNRVDILVNGTAHAPGGRPATEAVVELEAPGIRKRLRVLGDRYRSAGGPSAPQPFLTMPLVYERAYGGTDTHASDPKRHAVWRPNPVGVGFRSARPASPDILTEVPNLELLWGPNESRPAGFGIVSRAWSPRLELAGTFDRNWLEDHWPLMPRDFDPRHYQSAPEDQQTDALQAEDRIRITNCTPEGEWAFTVPFTDLRVWLVFDNRLSEARPHMDTVMVEPDSKRVSLTFRLPLVLERGRERLREIVFGHVTPGKLRAKFRRKPYLDFRTATNSPTGKGIA
jgi:hypothetical protein